MYFNNKLLSFLILMSSNELIEQQMIGTGFKY
ncbi:hypothetical protein LMOSLCC2378_2273 [Listeria monocytogenes SLCC2378]|nr:hypothetical protein LMOATCC19117_2268 [Listeria monocytogenes ATCC 19117]CBY74040.1 hypothetical protein LMOSLCC2378_2273 [Listeria monocytogenes SLCC2378]